MRPAPIVSTNQTAVPDHVTGHVDCVSVVAGVCWLALHCTLNWLVWQPASTARPIGPITAGYFNHWVLCACDGGCLPSCSRASLPAPRLHCLVMTGPRSLPAAALRVERAAMLDGRRQHLGERERMNPIVLRKEA